MPLQRLPAMLIILLLHLLAFLKAPFGDTDHEGAKQSE